MKCEGYMLICKDIHAAKAFYAKVIGAEVLLDIGKHVIFKEGFSLLQEDDWRDFADLPDADLLYRHHTGQLVFEVEVMADFLRHLESLPSPHLLHQVKEHPWGRWAVRLYDPDGHIVEVGESMKTVVKRFLSQGLSPEAAAARSEFPLDYVLACREEMESEKGN